jgi:hypothetical protein
MSPVEFRKALEHFSITQEDAARLFNGTANRSGRRWARNGAPFHVALILSMMHRRKLSVRYIDEVGEKWRKQMKTNQTQA